MMESRPLVTSNTRDNILQQLPLEKLTPLASTLTKDWPHFAYYHYLVKNFIKWKTKEPNLGINIYCPEAKYELGVFIAISSDSIYTLHTLAFRESKLLLYKCLTRTNKISWTSRVRIASVHEYFEDAVRKAINHLTVTLGLKIIDDNPSGYYFKSKDVCVAAEINVPDDMELKLLKQSDISVIHDVWPLVPLKKNPKLSYRFFSNLLRLGKGVGLYIKQENKLVSWVFQSEWGGLGIAQTLKEYQKNGYAKIVISALCKMIAEEENYDITLFVSQGNTPSEKLFTSQGFKRINKETFIITDL